MFSHPQATAPDRTYHSKNLKMRRLPISFNALLDVFLLGALLAGCNLVFARSDFGWLHLQPTPYIILPLLAGARYGKGAGYAGAALATLIAWVGSGFQHGEWLRFWPAYPGIFIWTVAIGWLCGDLQERYAAKQRSAESRGDELEQRLKQIDQELVFLRQSKDELNRLIALRDREQSTLDTSLRWLSASPSAQLAENTLALLSRHTRLTDGALYYKDSETGFFHREALVGSPEHLPPHLNASDIALAKAAVETGKTMTAPSLLREEPSLAARQPYLAAVPLHTSNSEVFGVLLVTGMPFIAFNPKSIELMEIITHWAASFIELKDDAFGNYHVIDNGNDSRKIYQPDFFRHMVHLSVEAYQKQRTPSSLVLLVAPEAGKQFQTELENTIVQTLRAGDYATELEIPLPHLAVLLPVTGERGAHIFMDRVLAGWRHEEQPLQCHHALLSSEDDLSALIERAQIPLHENAAAL